MKDILNFINGEYVSNVSGKTYESATRRQFPDRHGA